MPREHTAGKLSSLTRPPDLTAGAAKVRPGGYLETGVASRASLLRRGTLAVSSFSGHLMVPGSSLDDVILPAWRTNALITQRLVRALPQKVYAAAVPGVPRRTVRMLAAHLHNSRCGWLRTLGEPLGLRVPALVDRHTVSRRDLARALGQSGAAMLELLALGCARGGHIPPTPRYVWRNLALDVGHVLTYFVAHEAHHRGQLSLIARQLGVSLPSPVSAGLWQWKPAAGRRRTRVR